MTSAHRFGSSRGSPAQLIAASVSSIAVLIASSLHAIAQPLPPRDLPARTLPVPETVSPQMQKIIGNPISPTWNVFPKTAAEWKPLVDAAAAQAARQLPALREQMRVKLEATTLNGARAFVLTPDDMPAENRNRLLIHVHGGCYVSNPGESGTSEATMMAGFGRFKVISVDYRMPPEATFPAALDDAIAVLKAAQAIVPPRNIAIFGSSAGGGLTLSTVLRAKQLGMTLPGAIAPGTPMADLTEAGDTFHTNAMVDNVLIARQASCDTRARLYANGHDLKDPLLSPIYGDMRAFPPTMLLSGTRDLLLSNTVRVHRKLRQAGVEAALHVFEGQPHGAWYRDASAPESKEAFEEIARFFDRHLGK
ncbi:MAG TPA: alpha/beta hydrolase [Xanthobacteraceae bacterium]|jgi:acetyl esterase/lipase|nr:alpha/beta hydrolase [Xanthobacteraceae bacterium]